MRKVLAFIIVGVAACASAEPEVVTRTPVPATAPATAAAEEPPPTPASATTPAASNALLAVWAGPYGGVPPWDKVRPELFPEAFQAAIDARRAEIAAIAGNPAAPTFANTFVPLQNAGRMLTRVNVLFGVMTNNLNSPAYQALDREWSPKLAAASDEIVFNEKLFQRIETIYNNRTSAGLTDEQQRLVDRTYQQYVRSGARLNATQKAELGRINQQLAGLFSEFATKVLNDENSWILIENEADLAGLPESLRASYRSAAQERNLNGWAVVNTRSSVDPFLAFADQRALRERVWQAFKRRGENNNQNNTLGTIAQIVKLRAERARLLGYPSHAQWRMEDTMARDPQAAQQLMMRVWPAAVARVREEVADMQAIAKRSGQNLTIQPWDYLYYAEKVRKQRYDIDQNQLKPYFELNNMIDASMYTAHQLYGLSFHEITGQVPTFHPDVRV
ncbi:MAG TPA: M3 family metallopeptidase, partial [Longimicrobiales bacterium]